MGIRTVLGRAVNALLKPLGLRLCILDEQPHSDERPYYEEAWYLLPKYLELIEETHGCFSELIFPELVPCEGRVELLARLFGTQVGEAMYLLRFLHKSLELDGDVCEFGIAQGSTSALLANEIRATQKRLWLFDSFQGLPEPTQKDNLIDDWLHLGSMENYTGTMAYPVDEVQSKLTEIQFPLSRAKIVPGFIKETINSQSLPEKVCFAYMDFDLYEPILMVLKFLEKHLSRGGFAIVDDYGFFSSGVKTAVDEFVESQSGNFEIILPYSFAGHFCILRKKP